MPQVKPESNLSDAFFRFDKAASIASDAQFINVSQAFDVLTEVIDHLPQRHVILDEDVEAWLARAWRDTERRERMKYDGAPVEEAQIMKDTFKTCLWHVRRASGIGGSEVSALLEVIGKGEGGGFSSPKNVVLEKLLKKSPMPGTFHMTRGIRAEDFIQEHYHATKGVQSQQDELNQLRGYRWDKFPMVIGTPDDKVVDLLGSKKIVDYKAPSPDMLKKFLIDVPFQYRAQLHHYGILAKSIGLEFDSMALVPFDYEKWQTPEIDVPIDKTLMVNILEACDKVWNEYVMQGVVPEDPGKTILNDGTDEELEEKLAKGVSKIVFNKATTSALEEHLLDYRKELHAIAGDRFNIATGQISVKGGMATLKCNRAWDAEKLKAIAETVGIDPDDFSAPAKKPKVDKDACLELLEKFKSAANSPDELQALAQDLSVTGIPVEKPYDLDAMAQAIEEAGASPLEAASVDYKLNISRSKKAPIAEVVAALKEMATGAALHIDGIISDDIDAIYAQIDEIAKLNNEDEQEPEDDPDRVGPEGIATF